MKKRNVLRAVIVALLIPVLIITNSISVFGANVSNKKAPVILKITATKSCVKLYWSKMQGSSKYYVYRKTQNSKYKKIATVKKQKQSYTDTGVVTGKKYAYKIVSKQLLKSVPSKGREVTPVKIKAPLLLNLKRGITGKKEYAKLSWKAVKGCSYNVLRKTGSGSFSKIASVNAGSQTGSYTDKTLRSGKEYTYTVRPIRKVGKILYKIGDYDQKGIMTISTKPKVEVDCTNLHALISWKKVKGAAYYQVYRKTGLNGKYRRIATIKGGNSNKCLYEDIYRKSFTTPSEKKLLCAGYFIDPSSNGVIYTVRACNSNKGKMSYGNYYKDGDFYLSTPSIIGVTKNGKNKATIEWGTVKNAKEYNLYTGYNDSAGSRHWKKVKKVKQASSIRQKAKVIVNGDHSYYTVKAVSVKNGKTIYSGYDKGFNITDRKYDNKNILYIGDSITFGSPYKAESTREVFSYPWRVNQLTGARYYNPSIPGATYAYKKYSGKGYHRYSLVTDVAEKINCGKTPEQALHSNKQTYKDFDVVVMAAGTNDYLSAVEFGDLNSNKKETFDGAINEIIGYIRAGNEQRIQEGKSPIKIVFVNLFYSDRTNDYSKLVNRFVTPNKIGKTLMDYQNEIDSLIEKYKLEEGKVPNGMEFYQFGAENLITQSTCPYVTSDNLHMARFTYTQIGNRLTKFLVNNRIL